MQYGDKQKKQYERRNKILNRNYKKKLAFNAIFNNISAISWWSVSLVEETTDLRQVTDKHYNIVLYRVHLA